MPKYLVTFTIHSGPKYRNIVNVNRLGTLCFGVDLRKKELFMDLFVSLQRAGHAHHQSSDAKQAAVYRCLGDATMKRIVLMDRTKNQERAVSTNK